MSLFYNRDRNITGISTLTSFDFDPNYGSSISFTSKKNVTPYNNYTFSSIPITANNIVAECNFSFTKERATAQKIIDFFESQSGTGAFAINDSSSIYRTLTGFADEFAINMQTNNLYNISLKFNVERNSSALNWKGMSFVNYEYKEWKVGEVYEKYQPVYFEINAQDKTRNFFYATESHTSSLSNAPLTNGGSWSQSLFYENDFNLNIPTTPRIEKNFFKNSFIQRVKSQDNIHTFGNVQLVYKSISDFKLKSLLHFLENSLGYKRFEFNLPQIYNRPKIFYVEEWQHVWKYKDSNDLTITLIEDPLGIINQNDGAIINVGQQAYQTPNITISAIALNNDVFSINFTGKKESYTSYYDVFQWGQNKNRTVKVYRPLSKFQVLDEINSVDFLPQCSLKTGIFKVTGNVSFDRIKNIDNLFLDDSTITGLSLDNVSGLANLSIDTITLQNVSAKKIYGLTGLNFGDSPLNSGSFTNVITNVAAQNFVSGKLICSAVTNTNADLIYLNNLDYNNWTISLDNDISYPIQLTGAGGFNSEYFGNIQYKYAWFQTQNPLNTTFKWVPQIKSSYGSIEFSQSFNQQSDTWFYPDYNNRIAERPSYNLKDTTLTCTKSFNVGGRTSFSCFGVYKFNQFDLPSNLNKYIALINFSSSRRLGLFISPYALGTSPETYTTALYFADQNRTPSNYLLLATGLEPNTFYHIGFTKKNQYVSGFVNGQLTNSGVISTSSNSLPDFMSIGSAIGGHFLTGNICDLLIVEAELNTAYSGKFFRNYLTKYAIEG